MRSIPAALALLAFIAAVPGNTHAAIAADPACDGWNETTLQSGLGSLENLEFDDTGGLLLSASGPGAIERMTPDGTVTTLIPNVNAPGGQRVVGRTLYFNTGDAAQSGVTGTADGTLERYDLDTGARSTFATGLTMPNGLAVLPNGDFVVSRDLGSGTGITRIPHDDPAHPETNWAQIDDQNGMAVDPTGTFLYAVQTFTADSAVYKFRIGDPSEKTLVAPLAGPTPKGLDDMTIDAKGILYIAANGSGEVIRLNPATTQFCTIADGLQNPSSLKFGRGPGWAADHLYVTSFDGTVRELTPPAPTSGDNGSAGDGGSDGGSPAPAARDHLAMSVRPRTARVGVRRTFRFSVFRVHFGERTPVAGALVRLAGHSARTDRRGRASLRIRFRHAGTKRARATKRGLAATSKRVLVKRR